jgi:hypothetical protein
MAVDLFGNKCHDCNGSFPDACYDFHHVSGDKDDNVKAFLRRSFKAALKELQKCVLLCANCHRVRHYKGD